ncbi:MAG: cytochrome C [Acidobacteriota bacterium]|nr:MAG: cytochrome C [Acidobacteriota bacterium]
MPEQITRLIGFFLLILLGYFVVRPMVIPRSYGLYGRYRAAAVHELREREPRHIGNSACAECHEDTVESVAASRHASLSCESCHGVGQAHVESFGEAEMKRPELDDIPHFCGVCHHKRTGRPAAFPVVDIEEHMEGMTCTECHDPHAAEAM